MEKEIEKLYLSILNLIDELLIKCKDPNCFDIGIFNPSELENKLSKLYQLIETFNIATHINNLTPIKLKDITQNIYDKIKVIPDLIELYALHMKLAKSEFKNLNGKYTSLSPEVKIRCNSACSYINDKPNKKYIESQQKLEDIKSIYFKELYNKKTSNFIIGIKTKYRGINDANIIEFAKILKDKNHIDNDGEKDLIKLLKGEIPDKPIAWTGTKLKIAKSELSRLFQIMSKLEIFVNPSVSWIELEKNFTIDGNKFNKLINATDIIGTKKDSLKYKREQYFEEIVKGCFIYPNIKLNKS